MRYTNTFSGQNADFFKYEPGSIYSNHWFWKSYIVILTYIKHALQFFFSSRTLIIFDWRETTWPKTSRHLITCVYVILRAWCDHYTQSLFEFRAAVKVRRIWSLETAATPFRKFGWRYPQFVRTLSQDVLYVQDIRIRNQTWSQIEVLKIKNNTQRTCSQGGKALLRIWNVRGSNLGPESD